MLNMNASDLIDALGGTAEVARLFDVKSPSVSEWKANGIPKARLHYLKLLRESGQNAALAQAGVGDALDQLYAEAKAA